MASHPAPDRVVRRRPLRWVAGGLAATCLSTILVVAPTPRLVSAQELQVHTEHVRLAQRGPTRSSDAIAAAQAQSKEGPELRAALDGPNRRSSLRTGTSYRALGVGLPTIPGEPIFVRGRVDGAWTPWLELTFSPGEAPDRGTASAGQGVHSEPVWMGDADAYELDAPSAVGELDVHLVAEGPAQRELGVSPASAGAAAAPSILTRSAWGARPEKSHPETSADLKVAIVHHSVNSNTYTSAQVPELLRSIQAYHQDVQGWTDIAYNFVVDRFGQAWEGRAGGTTKVVVGGHSQGFNTGSVGVVVLGDFSTAAVSSAAVESVANVIAWKFALHRVNPASTVPYTSFGSAKYASGTTVTLPRIVGHRDVQLTECPGTLLYSSLATIRARVAALVPSYQSGLAPLVLDPDVDGDGLIDPFEYQPGAPADVQWRASATGQLTQVPTSVLGAYRPAVGDFDGDGRSDVFWHGTGSSLDWVFFWGTSAYTIQPLTVVGSYVPVVGDFDGNGVDDIFWYGTGLAADWVFYFQADRSYVIAGAKQDLGTAVPLVGDFNGDGRDDIFFYGPGAASDNLWLSAGQTWTVSARPVAGWYDPVVLDATGDGLDDILWFSPGSTIAYRWNFNSVSYTTVTLPTAPLLGRPKVGDFDGDGLEDVLLAAGGTAADEIWYSTPEGVVHKTVTVNGTYEIVVGKMDSDPSAATDDVLFVSATADYLWRGNANRTFRATKVG